MPKKKTIPKPTVVKKLLLLPSDWVDRIDVQRGTVSFADFVRSAVLEKIGREGLSEMPGWGKGRLKKPD